MTTTATDADLAVLATRLWEAEQTLDPIPQPSAAQAFGLDEAYAVQRANVARRIARGERVVGRKIGLTSLAMQQQLGVDQPDFGVITDAMVILNGGEFAPSTLIAPKLEAEFAFVIGGALPAEPTIEALREAISHVAVAIEIIDSRVADWRIGLVDTVADNASSARVVLGPLREASPKLLDSLPGVEIALRRDGEVQVAGPGSAVLGDPVVSLHWLATAIGRYGDSFEAGDVVLAGAVAASLPLAPHSRWEASASGFRSAVVITTD